jgi:hypothetical protein
MVHALLSWRVCSLSLGFTQLPVLWFFRIRMEYALHQFEADMRGMRVHLLGLEREFISFCWLSNVMAKWVWTVEKFSYETTDNTSEVWRTLPICYTNSFSSIAAENLYKLV